MATFRGREELPVNEHVFEFAKKKLFTPGPLTVSPGVKQAMTRDVGSRDAYFINIISCVRQKLVEIAGFPEEIYTSILLQGSGTFSVEAVLNSTSDRKKKVLILACGAYGLRMQKICEQGGIPFKLVLFAENQPVLFDDNIRDLVKSQEFSSLALVHCETTSGLINSVHEIGSALKSVDPTMTYIVDAMSSFGGVETDFSTIDFLISSSNKCLQGVPGFAFVICKMEKLLKTKGYSTSTSLDLYEQWKGLELNGQFRFTPPTHCILAFMEAIKELEAEGGVPMRAKRYKENNQIIKDGMTKLGFKRFVDDAIDGHIITSFKYPNDPNFDFDVFYKLLSEKGQLIYPGKVTNADCFRIGNIGHLFPADMHHLLMCIQEVMSSMGISIPVS